MGKLNYAGVHWPNGPEDYEKIMALPSSFILMLATEGRYHYDKVRKAGKIVVWRGLPREGKRPAELGWNNYQENANEALNLWDEQPHYGEEFFVPYNELDLNFERGDNEDDLDQSQWEDRYRKLRDFLNGVYTPLQEKLPNETKILFPPFTPDHGDIEYASIWKDIAEKYDGIVVHAYEDAERMRERISWYCTTFPDKPIILGEWNAPDPATVLRTLKDIQLAFPNFIGATYFIWHWYGAPGYWPKHYNIDENHDLYQLFLQQKEEKPMTREELKQLILSKADEYGLDRAEFLGGAFAESGKDLDQWERYGIWPDVSFGLYHQTVAFADEGNQTNTPENIQYVKSVYFDPVHACNVAAIKYKYWRYNPDVPALTAWCAYNLPSSYHNPESNPNIDNYRKSLELAARELGIVMPTQWRVYGPDVPDSVVLQKNDWSCAVRATYAALWQMHQQGHGEAVTYGDEGLRDVYEWMVPEFDSPSVGLHQADGSGLVTMLSRHGYKAGREYPTTLKTVQDRAGKQPVLIGGRAWNHWVYVRGVEEDGTLILENPSPGFGGIHHILRDSFDRLGPMTMVWIDVPTVSEFEFMFGFKTLAEELGSAVVGVPTENEHGMENDPRFNSQRTTKGLMVYSKLENKSYFIPG